MGSAVVKKRQLTSGGRSEELASARLNAMNIRAKTSGARVPWPFVFSFARAIQRPALEIWDGQAINTARAQQALHHRADRNHAALRGDYTAYMGSA
jgi:fructose-bisphosphate aldolase, class I